jgi:hypothetical protein
MPRSGSKNVSLAFTAGQLAHFGGVYLLHNFLQQLRLRTFLGRKLHIPERNNYFTMTERLLALIYPMILGLNTVELVTLLGTNGVFQYLTGLPRVPNPSTLRRFLIQRSGTLLPRIRTAHNILRAQFLTLPNTSTTYWLDFDSTARTLYGHQEGVVKGYNPGKKGKKSYHPLVCTEAHTQEVLGGALRYGNAHTAEGVEGMLDDILPLIPSTARTVRVRADAGFYNGDFIQRLSRENIGFAVVAPMKGPLRDLVITRRYRRVAENLSVAECRYQPMKWDKPYRYVALREKLTEERREQLKLFTVDRYAYHTIVTNLPLSPYNVFRFYEDRTGIERVIRTLKDDYPFATAPTNNFNANALYAELSLLAYNIVVWFKRLCLPNDWQSYTVGTLRHRLLLIPGVFVRSGNRPELRLPKNCLYQDVFTLAQKRIKELRSLT